MNKKDSQDTSAATGLFIAVHTHTHSTKSIAPSFTVNVLTYSENGRDCLIIWKEMSTQIKTGLTKKFIGSVALMLNESIAKLSMSWIWMFFVLSMEVSKSNQSFDPDSKCKSSFRVQKRPFFALN